jgi:hypothetical protein
MATAAGLTNLAELLARHGPSFRRRLRSGLILLADVPGDGEPVVRQRNYVIRLRMWLNHGEPVRWRLAWGRVGVARLDDNGETLTTEVRIERRSLIHGLFYGVEGMRVGGMRSLEIGPQLAFSTRGVPDVIPPNALLRAEIVILGSA